MILAAAGGIDALPAATLEVGVARYPTFAAAVAAVPSIRASHPAGEQIEIVLPPGLARLTAPVVIDAAHGGTTAAPLLIRGAGADRTRLVGTVLLPMRALTPNDIGRRQIPASARAIDLGALPVGDLVRRGAYVEAPLAGIELFQGSTRLVPSRWPATGYATAAVSGTNAQGLLVAVVGNRATAWRREHALWAGGYWGADWAFELAPVSAIGTDGSIRLAPLRGQIEARPTVRYFVENVLAELRQPGTFAVDGKRRVVILIPGGSAPIEAAVAPSLLVIDGAREITVTGIAFDRTLGPAVQVRNARDIRFVGCAFRQTGAEGVIVTGGSAVTFSRSVIASTAETGILLSGGDRTALVPAGHVFADGIVADFGLESPSYRPGVKLEGVGNHVRGSLLIGGDHVAVLVSGNDHGVVGNEIADVMRDAEDAGAIYMGADWSQRGIDLSGNYIHDLGGLRPSSFLAAIYLDDQFSGAQVAGNVLVGGSYGVVIGGGRDNRIERNLIVNPGSGGIHFDARGLGKQRDRVAEFTAKLARVHADNPAWLTRYPALRALTPDRYGAPDGNSVLANSIIGAPILVADPPGVAAMVEATGNIASPPGASSTSALISLAGRIPGGQIPPLANRAAALAALWPLRIVPPR